MVPAGEATADAIDTLKGSSRRATSSSTAATPTTRRPQPTADAAGRQGDRLHRRRHVGRGLGPANGYCLMVGGDPEAVAMCEPVFLALAPEGGYAHVGPVGAGHFVKMVHNGIEYGLMQAYAEGFEIMDKAARVRPRPPRDRLDLALRLGGALVAARAGRAGPRRRGRASTSIEGYVVDSGEGRWTVAGGHRPRRAGAGDHRRALRPLRLARTGRLLQPAASPRCATSSAATPWSPTSRRRRPKPPDDVTVDPPLDSRPTSTTEPVAPSPRARHRRRPPPLALVVFGASGDLAARKLLPAIAGLADHGALPERLHRGGVARTAWSDDEFREAARKAVPVGRPAWKSVVKPVPLRGGRVRPTPTPSTS